ncbi:hypothetical protein C9J12_08265 [Photobacterium frigidiphilum]|uniref:ArsR family transcriptional regulator n=1 Tax=Photobacterium frigidiphilum TaxID=264736 RepID=A0A2T3JKB9_9GAMM|nr:hypothetical protein [Photobacterium frigidiphilum]PSU49473.1 hypothetical protein C9J12_08265 [Photobacterium frigidiphilum]
MELEKFMKEDQRLVILRSLQEMPGYEANESIIDCCLDGWGHRVSRDAVRMHLSWLEEMALVSLRDLGDYKIATLTGRGEDVATGQAVVPGVKRPRAQ